MKKLAIGLFAAVLMVASTATGKNAWNGNMFGLYPQWGDAGLVTEPPNLTGQPEALAIDMEYRFSQECLKKTYVAYSKTLQLHWINANYSGCMAQKYAKVNKIVSQKARNIDANASAGF